MSSSESESEEYLTEGESSSNQATENDSSASDVEKTKENHRRSL